MRSRAKTRARRILLADGTPLSGDFSQRVWDALDREEIRRAYLDLPNGWVRVKASWGSHYDCPTEKIWWLGTAKQLDPGMTIVDSRKFQETDRQVFATLRLMFRAAQNLDV
jgi:uncharacterized protein YndB with AHSA1/START domain